MDAKDTLIIGELRRDARAPIKDRDMFQHLWEETEVADPAARTSERHSANQSRVPSAWSRSASQCAANVVVASGCVNRLNVER